MLAWLTSLQRSSFIRNVAIVASGSAGAQALTMLATPVITRLYSPAEFGILGIFTATLAFLAPIATLTYTTAIVLPRSDNEARQLGVISISLACVTSLVTLLVLLSLRHFDIANARDLLTLAFCLLLPAGMLLITAQQIFEQWMIRKKQFSSIAKATSGHSLLTNAAKITAGFYHPVSLALLLAHVLGLFFHALFLAIPRNGRALLEKADDSVKTSLRACCVKYADFPKFRAPQVAINAASQSLPVIILGIFYGPAVAGLYTLSKSIIGVPSALVGKAVGDVFYPRIAESAHNGESISALNRKATLGLLLIGALPFGLVIAFGPTLFAIIFGSEWETSGEYARYLAFWFYTIFATTPSAKVLPVIFEQKFDLYFSIYKLIVRTAAIIIPTVFFQNAMLTVVLLSFLSMAMNLQFYFMVQNRAKRYEQSRHS